MEENKFTLHVISHTHWDREWYQTFQAYRFRLVRTIDDLLDLMEKDDEYKYFHLDGQTIPLLDYLKIRPQNKERLAKLIQAGRIIIGPWYCMPDEFLISGEALVRNLQMGIQVCREFGVDYMKNGYVTDIFGHNGQFPQILNGLGIYSATLYRGIGDYPKDLFSWEAADGSKVITFKMDPDRCYSNWYFALRWPFQDTGYNNDEDLLKRAGELIERAKSFAASKALLMMDGVDHIDADPELPRIIKLINEKYPYVNVIHSTMEQYEAQVKAENPQLETIRGPLYNIGNKGLNNSVLRNVLSSIVHIKQMNDRSESLLTGWAEPLDAGTFLVKNKIKPDSSIRYGSPRSDFLKEAWRFVVENQPHDSICGCSLTEVHKDNENRFKQAIEIGEEITDDAMYEIANNVDTSNMIHDFSYIVFNPSSVPVDGLREIGFDIPHNQHGNFRIYDEKGQEVPYQILDVSGPWHKYVAPLRKLIHFDLRETVKVVAHLKIPGNGYSTYTIKIFQDVGPGPGEYKRSYEPDRTRLLGTMRLARNKWDNGKIIMEIAPNGTLTITNKASGKIYSNVLAFEDTGDIGNGWVYRKPLLDSEYLSICGEADVAVENDGPLSVTLRITRRMMLPKGMEGERRGSERDLLEIVSKVTLHKDSSMLDVVTKVDNDLTNHRLRVLVPTGYETDEFFTQTPFDMQKWNVYKGDWSTYKEAETFVNPTQGVVYVSDGRDSLEVYSKGLYEVEVMESDRTVALTLFRSFNGEHGLFTADWPRMHRKMKFEYAFVFGCPDAGSSPDRALARGIAWKLGLRSYRTGKHEGSLPSSMSFADIKCSHSVVSGMYVAGDGAAGEDASLIIRLYNASDCFDEGTVTFPRDIKLAEYIDLKWDSAGGMEFSGNKLKFAAGPHKIVTMKVQF